VKKTTWRNLTVKTIEKFSWQKDMYPKAVDPINGLILASGHYIIHIAFFFSIFFVEKAKDTLICLEENEVGEVTPKEININLN
jgi:hypothetical protein